MALWRAKDKPPVELVVANLDKYRQSVNIKFLTNRLYYAIIPNLEGVYMAKKKVYAVKKGKQTGLFYSWNECKESVSGYP